MSESDKARLERNLIGWVPAREFVYDRDSFRRALDVYRGHYGRRAAPAI